MQPAVQAWLAECRRMAVALLLTAVAIAVMALPGAAQWLAFDRQAIAAGQWWRLVAGHLTHWNANHLLWDGLMFAALGGLLERTSRRRFVGLCLSSALAISLAIWWLYPDLATYRGLSGVDTALFVCLAGDLLAGACRERRWRAATVPGGLLAGLALKLGYESMTGQTLFVDSADAGFTVIVAAHVVGALVGAAFALAPLVRRESPAPADDRPGTKGATPDSPGRVGAADEALGNGPQPLPQQPQRGATAALGAGFHTPPRAARRRWPGQVAVSICRRSSR